MAKSGNISPGKSVIIIGAGNVGCDVATEAHRLGAEDITLLDIQEPLSFGKERKAAEEIGAKFRWPVVSKKITQEGVELNTGEVIPADTVVISIGDAPDIEFLPESVKTERGFITVNAYGQTGDPKIFAIGDAVKPGLLTDAIGAGRKAAKAISDIFRNGCPSDESSCHIIDRKRVTLEYFDPRITEFQDIAHCGSQCSSCGTCRDCSVCVTVCPRSAISRKETNSAYEYIVDGERCIGCGFCAQACPCGVWNLTENTPIG